MSTRFFDRENDSNELNGTVVTDVSVADLLRTLRNRSPFFCEFVAEGGKCLLVGLGSNFGCAQFSATDGMPPYLVAVAVHPEQEGEMEFLISGVLTPIPNRFKLSGEVLEQVVTFFVATGEKMPTVQWEEI